MRHAGRSIGRRGLEMTWDMACRALEVLAPPRQVTQDLPPLRIALVKQSTYTDLYTDPSATTPAALLFSSGHRSGPIGLFAHFDAKFFIVKVEDDPECQAWLEKRQFDTHPDWNELHRAMEAVAVRADSVQWSDFDLVIAMDTAVPSRIARRHPSTLWATMLEHHRLANYRRYCVAPPEGYHALLSQHYGPTPTSCSRRSHVIEWPYGFIRSDTFRLILPDSPKRRKVHYEANQAQPESHYRDLLDPQHVELTAGGNRSLRGHLNELLSARVFFAPRSSRRLWGNSLSEAVAAGCVCIGRRSDYWNPCLIPPGLNCPGDASACELVRNVLDNAEVRLQLLAAQQRRLDWYCFWRPLQQLFQHVTRFGGQLRINNLASSFVPH